MHSPAVALPRRAQAGCESFLQTAVSCLVVYLSRPRRSVARRVRDVFDICFVHLSVSLHTHSMARRDRKGRSEAIGHLPACSRPVPPGWVVQWLDS